jgi:hypothetical protein
MRRLPMRRLFILGVYFWRFASSSPPPGPYVLSFLPASLGSSEAHLSAALPGCGRVEGFLPPSSLLLYLHAPTPACFRSLASVPGAAAPAAPLPARARMDPALAGGVAAPPLRALSLLLAGGGHPAGLSAVLAAHCPACAPPVFIDGGRGAHVSALGGCPGCALDAPASRACACALPAALPGALAELPEVLWVGRVGDARGMDAGGVAALTAGDYYNVGALPTLRPRDPEGSADNEYVWTPGDGETGACLGTEGCDFVALLPFAAMARRYGPFNNSSPAAARRAAGAAAGCGAGACGGLACGFGFGSCAGLERPPLFDVGLTGEGQVVLVVNDGVAVGGPFFLDPAGAAPAVGAAPVPPVLPAAHRKVAYYWAYVDAIDAGTPGHGTHTASAVAGDALALPALGANERALFSFAQGVAPGARIIVADFTCNTAGGCPQTEPGSPPRASATCPAGAWCPPLSVVDAYEPARVAGAGVASNPWGSGTESGAYTTVSAALDAYVFSNASDMLLVFSAAGNASQWAQFVGFPEARVSEQAAAKNVLAVGSTFDGLLFHAQKMGAPAGAAGAAPLFHPADGRACASIVARVAKEPSGGNVLVPAPCASAGDRGPCLACPSAPTPAQCYALAVAGRGVYTITDYYRAYAFTNSVELALCCGCGLADVAEGCQVAGGPCNPAAPGAKVALWDLLMDLQYAYNARMNTAAANALGPTADGRVKPDVVAPGVDVVGAAAGLNDFPFNGGPEGGAFQCPEGVSTFDVPLEPCVAYSPPPLHFSPLSRHFLRYPAPPPPPPSLTSAHGLGLSSPLSPARLFTLLAPNFLTTARASCLSPPCNSTSPFASAASPCPSGAAARAGLSWPLLGLRDSDGLSPFAWRTPPQPPTKTLP